jgi:hypothetical protein
MGGEVRVIIVTTTFVFCSRILFSIILQNKVVFIKRLPVEIKMGKKGLDGFGAKKAHVINIKMSILLYVLLGFLIRC